MHKQMLSIDAAASVMIFYVVDYQGKLILLAEGFTLSERYAAAIHSIDHLLGACESGFSSPPH
jgi:hypothetical protein